MGFKWELLVRDVEIWDSKPIKHIGIIISSILWQIKWLTRDYELYKLRVNKWIICCLLLQRNYNDWNTFQQKPKTTSWKCHITINFLSNISLPKKTMGWTCVYDHRKLLEFFGKNLWARGAPLLLYLNIAKHAPFKMVIMAFSKIATIIELLLTPLLGFLEVLFLGKKTPRGASPPKLCVT